MTFSRNGDKVTLEMTAEDWERLLVFLGMALGVAVRNPGWARSMMQFLNELNRTNPNFTPYEVKDGR